MLKCNHSCFPLFAQLRGQLFGCGMVVGHNLSYLLLEFA